MAIQAIGLIDPILQFVDGDGNPYASGTVGFYQVGTGTLQDVYSDSALTTPLTNPVPLNAAGKTSTSISGPATGVWLQQKTYDYILRNAAGTTIQGPITISGSQWPGQVQGQAILSPAANANGYTNRFTTTINKASSGTHALFAGTRFDIPTIGAGGSTLTESATVYIEGEPATGTAAYALHVDAGDVLFDGDLTVLGTFNQMNFGLNSFRLSLTTAVPVTTADVTAATSIFAVPYGGSQIALYNASGTAMLYVSAQFTIAVPASTNQVYDIFCYAVGTVPTLELTAWTNDTTRATAIVSNVASGIYTKSGDATRRLLGTFRTTGVSGQTEDSFAKRYLWNYYHRVIRPGRVTEATNSWTSTTATPHLANGAAANQLDFVIGVAEVTVTVDVYAACANTDATAGAIRTGVGEDSSTVYATGSTFLPANMAANTMLTIMPIGAHLQKYPAVGRHTYVWLVQAGGSGTTTFYGDGGGTDLNQGIFGWIMG